MPLSLDRRHCLATLLLGPAVARAAAYPDRPVRMLVPFGAGGITDLVARITAEQLARQLGQPIVVENRPGSGGNIAAAALVQAPADGYTVMFTTLALLTVNPHVYEKLPFDPFTSFSFVSTIASTPHVIAVRSSLPITSLKELVREAARKPEALSFGTAGVGSAPHQGLEILQRAAGVKLLHVPYKSGAASVGAVVSGEIDVTFEALPVVMPHVASGRLRALALAAPRRQASAPELATTAELGFPSLVSGSISGIVTPAGLPGDVLTRLRKAVKGALTSTEVKGRLFAQGSSVMESSPDDFLFLVRAEHSRWGSVFKPATTKP